ncbi:MAG: right-handed parallel beta-helix repeat-containing protein [candidate division Zixibacteria bacterium]|nr:right-handed parallel beta-helix repeat-containing protein [candidate division Zixibacteria bacterium]
MRIKTLSIFIIGCLIIFTAVSGAETYYMSKTGNDNASGTSWAEAWTSIDKINVSLTAGDTVLFGTGRWFDAQVFPPLGGQSAGWTVYACSTFADGGDGSDSWLRTSIIGGDSVVNWTQYDMSNGRNIWRAEWYGNDCWYGAPDNDNGRRSFTLVQDDSLLKCELTVGAIVQEGQWTHIENENMIYSWVLGGKNPNNLEMISSCKPAFRFYHDDQDRIKVYGLDLRAGKQGVVLFTNGACDSIQIIHCRIRHVGHDYGENPACIMSRTKAFDGPVFKFVTHALIRGCDISSARGTHAAYYEHAGTGIEMYCTKLSTIDSCYIHDLAGDGVYFKNELDPAPDSLVEGNVVRFSRFENIRYYAIGAGKNAIHDSVYGCTFQNIGETAIMLDYQNNVAYGGHFVCNNTFYNVSQFWWTRFAQTGTEIGQVKYNVFYDRGSPSYSPHYYANFMRFGEAQHDGEVNRSYTVIDSNIYYDPNESFSAYANYSYQSFAGWQSLGLDVHGSWSDPGLNNPAAGDFSRPSVSQEMNFTYGGRTWVNYGAWQSDDPVPDPDSSDNYALNKTPIVSGTYAGYLAAAITDGVKTPTGGPATTWSSDQSSSPHWIEIDLGQTRSIQGIKIYWAWNSFSSNWTNSQRLQIQRWNGSSFVDIETINTNDTLSFVTTEDTVTAHPGNAITYTSSDSCITMAGFAPVATSRIRIYQPSNSGSVGYSTVLWIAELEIYGKDVVPPAIESPDLGALPGDKNGEIELFWKAPGDDGLSGRARLYAIKYSRFDFTAADWNSLPFFINPPYPKQAGEQEHMLIGGLEAGATYYIALKAIDERGNVSAMTNTVEVTAFISQISLGGDDTLDVVSPVAGAELHTSHPILTVNNFDAADTNIYFFEIAANHEFTDIIEVSNNVIQEPWNTTSWQSSVKLRNNRAYYWRARVNNTYFSKTMTFTVIPQTHAYPNPFDRSRSDAATFTELPNSGDIIVMTVSGSTIRYLTNNNGRDISWDGTNQDGQPVASGTYLWFVEGTDINGKIVVTR